ncbi:MAG: HAD hydrolase family protein [Ruminococcus sp.]|nr:HAD hydrolase family protein [Ruminococcus sp.]
MNTLYVSDLDGTLLKSDETISEYTNEIINSLTEKGMIFSYATARSFVTAKKVTKGLNAKIPVIVYNGAFVIDSRKGDIRTNAVKTVSDLKSGKIFYITCIDEPRKLEPLYKKYQHDFHCVYQKDIYSEEQWLEIMPKETSKSNAINHLQSLMKCERLVVFGDGKNDIDMFLSADEGYAVQNAHDDLKKYATAIISSNNNNGVAKWLECNYNRINSDVYEGNEKIGNLKKFHEVDKNT